MEIYVNLLLITVTVLLQLCEDLANNEVYPVKSNPKGNVSRIE